MSETPISQLTDEKFAEITAGFDLDAFVSGATPKTRKVRIFQKGHLVGEIDALRDQIKRAELTRRKGFDSVGDESPETLRRRLSAVAKEAYEASVLVEIRGLANDRIKEISKTAQKTKRADGTQMSKDEKDRHTTASLLAAAIVFPAFGSVDDVNRFITAIGDNQLTELGNTFQDACYLPHQVDVPFSLVSSEDEEPDT